MKVDMSPKAVKARLKLVSDLTRLSISLGNAKNETHARLKVEKTTDSKTTKVK